MTKQTLLLKWGTIKGWSGANESTQKLLQEYHDLGASVSVMTQKDTDQQKEIICKIIDNVDTIQNDWSGEMMTKDEAKKYVREY